MEEGSWFLAEGSSASKEARRVWQLRLGEVAVDVDFRRLFGVGGEEAGIAVVDVEVVAEVSDKIIIFSVRSATGKVDVHPPPSPPRRSRQLAPAGHKAQVISVQLFRNHVLHPFLSSSVGHLIIDSLASRLGIPLASDASVHGHHGQGQVSHSTAPYEVTLYKSSPRTFHPLSLSPPYPPFVVQNPS